jgi:Flp pilus assembly protein CpaB
MNLLSLIIIALALVVTGTIGYIAWDLTSEESMSGSKKVEPGESKESSDTPGPGEQT